ncbi:MAG: TIGR00730 family Rossman fold protein [Bacteroidales bacterium]|jgi:hypothetical protein
MMANNLTYNRICVYCASSNKTPEKYLEHGRAFARILAENKIDLVFGGSRSGLMGVMADEVMKHGGRTIGIMPRFMQEVEWHHEELTRMITTETMAQRKEAMIHEVDAVVTFPGGCGTMEEFMETLSLKRLGLFNKPMIVLNSYGFYAPLIDLLDAMLRDHFLGPKHREMWTIVDTPDKILPAIAANDNWDSEARSFALVQ